MSSVTAEGESPSAEHLEKGTVIAGKYRVEYLVGEGGMGYVMAAEHIQLGHRVALKILRASALEAGDGVERFLREARATARLQSEHIARVSDVGTLDSGLPYMVMELLEGADLARILEVKGPLAISDAIDAIVQACEALADAHANGIVHRDLKPANLFRSQKLDGSPFIKVLDFGISKTKLGAPLKDITSTTAIIGSPKYMSPEQMQDSRAVDPRSDIWALGAILYELLTGEKAFDASTIATLCVKVLQEPAPSARAKRPEVPEELDAILLRCMTKDPAGRFASVAELAEQLAPFGPPESRSLSLRIQRMTLGRGRAASSNNMAGAALTTGAEIAAVASFSPASVRSGGPASAPSSARSAQISVPRGLSSDSDPIGTLSASARASNESASELRAAARSTPRTQPRVLPSDAPMGKRRTMVVAVVLACGLVLAVVAFRGRSAPHEGAAAERASEVAPKVLSAPVRADIAPSGAAPAVSAMAAPSGSSSTSASSAASARVAPPALGKPAVASTSALPPVTTSSPPAVTIAVPVTVVPPPPPPAAGTPTTPGGVDDRALEERH